MNPNNELKKINEWNILRGFKNLAHKENRSWWSTRKWWINALVWPVLLCGLTANMLFVPTITNLASPEEIARAGSKTAYVVMTGLSAFFEFGTMVIALGAIILCMDLVFEEKNNGVLEWLLSKPVTRRAYLLSKLLVSLLYCSFFMVVIPASLAYGLFSLKQGGLFPVQPFLSGVGIMVLHLAFYVSLTLLLGVIFSSRMPVLGLSLSMVLGGNLIASLIKPLLYISPWALPKIASLIAGNQPAPPELIWLPVFSTAFWFVIFVIGSLVIIEREEF